MTRARLLPTTAVGIVVALAYVALASVSGAIDPLERRPLLDGLTPPPPYQWVSPPPALASSNRPAESADLSVPIQNGVSTVGVFVTPDGQATVLLQQGAIPLPPGATTATFRLHALAPPANAVLPQGIDVLGNVYRIDLVVGSNAPSTQIASPAQVALVYPAQAGPPKGHELLRSDDGTTFRSLGGNDNPVGLQVLATTATLGYFAVGSGATSAITTAAPPPSVAVSVSVLPSVAVVATPTPVATSSPPASTTPPLLPVALVGVPIALFVIFAVVEVLARRGRSRRL